MLVCERGRWKQALTLGEAADILLSLQAGSIESASSAPLKAVAGGGFDNALAFRVLSKNGKPLANTAVTLGGPSLAADTPRTAVSGADGVVRFPFATVGVAAGTWELTASIDGAGISTTVPVAIRAAEAERVVLLGGNNQTVAVGTALAPLSVRATDRFGNPVAGAPVLFVSSTGSQPGPSIHTVTSGADGVASSTPGFLSAPNGVGAFKVGVSIRTHLTTLAEFNHTAISGAPGYLTLISATSLSVPTDTPFPDPIVVDVFDWQGNKVPGATVTFAIRTNAMFPDSEAAATFSSTSVVTDSAGRATVTATSNGIAGLYEITATAGGASTYVQVTNTP